MRIVGLRDVGLPQCDSPTVLHIIIIKSQYYEKNILVFYGSIGYALLFSM